jgi:hypothetical protein
LILNGNTRSKGEYFMYKLKNSLFALVGLLALVGAISVLTPRSGFGQKASTQPTPIPPPVNVNVVNTPLPVTGTISVGNLGDSPLPVRDVDNPARQPVSATANCSESTGTNCEATIYSVPAGKRLVIEYVSFQARVPFGQVAYMSITGGPYFPFSQPAVSFPGANVVRFAEQVRLYSEPGTTLVVQGERTGSGLSSTNFSFFISGYLVDVP